MISKKDLLRSINDLFALDKNTHKKIDRLQEEIRLIKTSLVYTKDNTLEKQLQCAAKGHNFIFDNYISTIYYREISGDLNKIQFKCSNCNLTIIKTKNELTSKEQKALIDLKILEENNAKTTKTKTTN